MVAHTDGSRVGYIWDAVNLCLSLRCGSIYLYNLLGSEPDELTYTERSMAGPVDRPR